MSIVIGDKGAYITKGEIVRVEVIDIVSRGPALQAVVVFKPEIGSEWPKKTRVRADGTHLQLMSTAIRNLKKD